MDYNNIKLEDCELITSEQWCALNNPKWLAQTRVVNNYYYMIWEHNGKLYKTHNQVVPDALYYALAQRAKKQAV